MIVGLAGRKRSGKDTAAALLVERYGFKRVAFADGVREFVAAMFNWPLEWVNSDDFKTMVQAQVTLLGQGGPPFEVKSAYHAMRGRELLQRVGTEAGRKVFGDDCWIKVALAKCGPQWCDRCGNVVQAHDAMGVASGCAFKQNAATQNYVITDVRFPNELAAIKAVGGIVLRLNRADQQKRHAYVPCPLLANGLPECNLGPVCHYDIEPGRIVFCKLPREAHPSHYSGDTHPSETSLPDASNETIKYDSVIMGDSVGATAGAVLSTVGGLLK